MEYEDRYVHCDTLIYIPSENIFIDSIEDPCPHVSTAYMGSEVTEGMTIFNIHDYVPPAIVEEFLEKKEDMFYEVTPTHIVWLIYAEGEWLQEDAELLEAYRYAVENDKDLEDYNGPYADQTENE